MPLLNRALKAMNLLPEAGSNKPKKRARRSRDSRPETPRRERPTDPKCLELAQLLNCDVEAVRMEIPRHPDAAEKEYLLADLAFETCTLTLAFATNLVEAYLAGFCWSGDFEQEDLFALLESYNLTCLSFEPIERAVIALVDAGRETGWREIAMGVPPEHGTAQKPRLHFDAEAEVQARPYFATLASGKIDAFPEAMRALWVEPGEVLATLDPPREGTPGRDVFGYEIPAAAGEPCALGPGPGVDLSSDGSELRAKECGYLFLHAETIGVFDPLSVDAAGVSCHFDLIPTVGPAPKATRITELLERRGVRRGVDLELVERLSNAEVGGRPERHLVAAGKTARHGRSGRIEYAVERDRSAGEIKADGTIDFRETYQALNVAKGSRLAVLYPAIEGEAGYTVYGEDTEAPEAESASLKAGPNVELREAGGGIQHFRATIDGRVFFAGDTVSVRETLEIFTDINYETGNVEFHGDVFVSGSVLPGFTVQASGSVYLSGLAEAGSQVSSGCDIVVGGGIVGADTRVFAEGSIAARFVRDAEVRCSGDLQIGCHILNAQVCNGGVVCVCRNGLARSGTINGGQVIGARGIRATFAGSPNGTRTELVAGVDPKIQEDLRSCQQELGACQEDLDRLHRLLGTDAITVPELKVLLRRTSPHRHPQISEYIREWQRTSRVAKMVQTRKEKLNRELTQSALAAMVQVSDTIYPGVRVRVGDRSTVVKAEVQDTTLTQETWPDDERLRAA